MSGLINRQAKKLLEEEAKNKVNSGKQDQKKGEGEAVKGTVPTTGWGDLGKEQPGDQTKEQLGDQAKGQPAD